MHAGPGGATAAARRSFGSRSLCRSPTRCPALGKPTGSGTRQGPITAAPSVLRRAEPVFWTAARGDVPALPDAPALIPTATMAGAVVRVRSCLMRALMWAAVADKRAASLRPQWATSGARAGFAFAGGRAPRLFSRIRVLISARGRNGVAMRSSAGSTCRRCLTAQLVWIWSVPRILAYRRRLYLA